MKDATSNNAVENMFPIVEGRHRVELVSFSEGRGVLRLLVLDEDGSLCNMLEQEVDLSPFSDADVAELATRVRAKLAASEHGVLPGELFVPASPYVPVDIAADDDPRVWLSRLVGAIRGQALARGFDDRFSVLEQWIEPARTVYFVHLAVAMIGGNGIQTFLHQADFLDVVGVLAAVEACGCQRFAERYRQGLTLAARQEAECYLYGDQDWLAREGREPPAAGWADIDSWEQGSSWQLLESEVRPALARYVEIHRAELCRAR